jgi:hypothetical protein
VRAHGLELAELVRRVGLTSSPITAAVLRHWLLAEELAVERDGLLEPTKLCVALGGLLA